MMESYISVIDNIGRLLVPKAITDRANVGREAVFRILEGQITADLSDNRKCLICASSQDLMEKNGLSICRSCIKRALNDELINIKEEDKEEGGQLIDDEGRLYIPEFFRRKLCIGFNTSVMLEFDEHNLKLFIRPEVAGCFICGSNNKVYNFEKINLCGLCYKKLIKEYREDV